MEYDVVVIGGGPAGSTVGGFLTQLGRSVLVLEKERFPRHHIGESMIASTLDVLAEIGLGPKIDAAGFPVKSGGCFIWGETTDPWCIRFDEIPGRPTSYQVKRDVFDKILLDHVAEMGADVRQEARVNEVLIEDGRVVGVSFEHEGQTHQARAKYVVDASGLNAVVANKLSTREAAEELKNMALYGYWKGVHPAPAALGGDIRPTDRNNIIIKMLDTGWLWFIPLGFDDIISVGYVTQRDNLPEARGKAALEEYYLDRVKNSEEFGYLLSNSEYTDDFYTVKDWSYRSVEMAGAGYFAVGDAACFVDPILSSGVYLAVLYAKLCAVGVNTCLTEPGREEMIQDWYEGLYADTYTDYLAMARLWYHGDRKVQKWMHQAQDQLTTSVASEYTETDRSSFIGLATGNAHTHPNYVLLRELSSYPLPLLLRKDPRLGFHKEAHTALMAHADPTMLDAEQAQEKAKSGMASSQKMRVAIATMLAATRPPVEKLTAETSGTDPKDEATVEVASSVRLSLEVVDDRVEMLVTTGAGERRVLSRPEQDLLALVAEKPSLANLRDSAKRDGHPVSFLEELLDAGVLSAV
ncbi:MAG: NAD(P)/FAD-dependent oxidoreductase [Acidimicrobiia bacterium]